MQDRCAGQVEEVVKRSQSREAAAHQAGAMVAAPAGDDLFLLRTTEDVVDVPDQLEIGLVGVRSGEAEEHAAHGLGSAVDDHLGQPDRGLGAMAHIGMVIRQGSGLCGNGVGDLGAAIADIDAIEAREGVEAALALPVHDVDALAPGDDAVRRLSAGMLGHVRGRMEEMVPVPGVEFVVCVGGFVQHGWLRIS
jgi:hypothetical protein